ncbi:Lnb N-terminal periplasmic domain-containing protein [Maribellus maritimus]|uniref:Lnb N-terminal periplasmic domain-containing protein n=1 Tax=Maribellus maritimus TaxID=2870838 RepID=UPI001EEA60EE|nr:DUF4105 domain-containing protein [Maribellus maritimus]MCG6189068.1 DUF4105 domain-containing protein [Maribellus maritimus]
MSMRIQRLTFLLILAFLLQNKETRAFVLSRHSEISVLTCSPGDEAYSVYGHSAIRVKDESYNYDVVFNYGIFDFSSPNFLYRFASGQTDYLLGAYGFSDFVDDYIAAKRSIYEQVLNLTQHEKQKVFDFLLWNAQPENRVYRYNFLFDNCATRVRDVIQEQSDGNVNFPEKPENQKTFRDLIKEYHSKLLWLNFGIDLIVVAPSDKDASAFEEMFLPDYLMGHFTNSTITTGNETKPLVRATNVIYQAPESTFKSLKIVSPFVVFGILLLLVIYVSVRQWRKKKINYLTDYLVFGINGFMGVVMLWFVLYSEHPAMHPNYNLLWAIPVNLIFIFIWKIKKWRTVTRYYFVVVSVWLLLFLLLGSLVPQKFHVVFYLLTLIVLARAVLNTLFVLRGKTFDRLT